MHYRFILIFFLGIALYADQKAMTHDAQTTHETLLSGTLHLHIGTASFRAKLFANASSLEFKQRLPLTLHMHDLHHNEKYHPFSHPFSSSPQKVSMVNTGDLMLWQDNSFVLFYKTFSTPYAYTKLGYLEETRHLQEVLGDSDITLRLTWEP